MNTNNFNIFFEANYIRILYYVKVTFNKCNLPKCKYFLKYDVMVDGFKSK